MELEEVKQWVAGWVKRNLFSRFEFLSSSRGETDQGKPIITNRDGKVDPSFIDDSGIDHGSIGGLGDDDHTQYFLANGSRRIYDGVMNKMFTSKGAIDGTPQTIIADGAGDIVLIGSVRGVLYNDVPQIFSFEGDLVGSTFGGGTNLDFTSDTGTNTLRISSSAGGALTVVRQTGSAFWQIAIEIIWM